MDRSMDTSKYVFIFVDETSWREYKSQSMSDHGKPRFIMELLREVIGTAEVTLSSPQFSPFFKSQFL